MSFRLTISKVMIAFGLAIGAGLIAIVAANKMTLNQVSPDGGLHRKESLANELLADILPPPAYIIESYLETRLLLSEPEKLQAHEARLKQLHAEYEDRKKYWKEHPVDPDVNAALEAALPAAERFWQTTESDFLPAMRKADLKAAGVAFKTLTALYTEHRQAIDVLVPKTRQMAERYKARAQETDTYFQTISNSIALLVLAVLVGGVAGIMRGVIRPVLRVNAGMKVLASGDYTKPAGATRRKDEVGQLVNSMNALQNALLASQHAMAEQTTLIVTSIGEGLDHLAKGDLTQPVSADLTGPFSKLKHDFNGALVRLRDTIGVVLTGTHQIGTGASEISQAADDLSQRTEQQAASLEQTAAALEEITATVQKTASHAKEVSTIVRGARAAAEQGSLVVGTAVDAMTALDASSQKITDIIGVINGIAFQTNLLALNAGVEAARAGDAGRGFAIVAAEVRGLAQRSSEAAREIERLIKTSTANVGASVKLVSETGQALTQIGTHVSQIDSLITELAQAAEQQSIGIAEVNDTVGQMDRVTQHNASMVEQTTAASRNLASETARLVRAVSFFRVDDKKKPDAPVARPKPKSRTATLGALALKENPEPAAEWEEF